MLQRADRAPPPASLTFTPEQRVYTSVEDVPSQILELTDITDIPLRLKVAQLLAIAPELPTKDLCNLLIGTRGNVEMARESMFRQAAWQNGLLSMSGHTKKVKPEKEERLQHHSDPNDEVMVHGSDGDKEAVLTKLEADDPEIWNDNDILASPTPTIRNLRETRLARKNTTTSQSLTSGKFYTLPLPSTKAFSIESSSVKSDHRASMSKHRCNGVAYSTLSDTVTTPTSEYGSSKRPDYSPYITPPQGPIYRARRNNSIDDVFVIPDTEIESDLDGLYEDSHQGSSTEDDGYGSWGMEVGGPAKGVAH